MATDPDTANAEEDIVEPTSPFVVYAPLILATISALGFVVTVGVLIFSRVFRLGKFFAEFTALRETVDDLQETVASNKVELEQAIADNRTELQQAIADNRTELQQAIDNRTELQQAIADNRTELQQAIADNRTELQQAIADNRAEIDELRQEMREGFARTDARIEAGLQELRGYFVAHLEYHANYPGDDD